MEIGGLGNCRWKASVKALLPSARWPLTSEGRVRGGPCRSSDIGCLRPNNAPCPALPAVPAAHLRDIPAGFWDSNRASLRASIEYKPACTWPIYSGRGSSILSASRKPRHPAVGSRLSRLPAQSVFGVLHAVGASSSLRAETATKQSEHPWGGQNGTGVRCKIILVMVVLISPPPFIA